MGGSNFLDNVRAPVLYLNLSEFQDPNSTLELQFFVECQISGRFFEPGCTNPRFPLWMIVRMTTRRMPVLATSDPIRIAVTRHFQFCSKCRGFGWDVAGPRFQSQGVDDALHEPV